MTRLEYLQAVKKLLPPAPVCAEIGVYRGDFSKMILDELKPENLLLIDSWNIYYDDRYKDGSNVLYSTYEDCIYVSERFKDLLYSRVAMFRGLSKYGSYYYNKSRFDFIYIDADHRYESVKMDLEMWFPLLSDNGIIGGHDYGNEVFTGVKKAVDEFANENKLSITLLSDEGDFSLIKNDHIY